MCCDRRAQRYVLYCCWCYWRCGVGVQAFSRPVVDATSQYDLVIIHAAGRAVIAGADPYSLEFVASVGADPHGTPYAYPLASIWLLLLFLPFPIAWAAMLWVSVSVCCLVALAPLVAGEPRWLFPITFELGWANSLQITLFTVAPAILACMLARAPTDRPGTEARAGTTIESAAAPMTIREGTREDTIF